MTRMTGAWPALALALVTPAMAPQAHADDEPQQQAGGPAETVERVVVTGTRDSQAILIDRLSSTGPLGPEPVINQPYSISILPQEIIQSSQATNFKDVSKYLPLVQYQEQQGPEILRPQTRGMQGGNFQNTKLDGMTMFITGATAMEQFQQIEVLNGAASSVYGPANPSGMFNFISKRAPDEPLHEVTATYVSDGIGTVKVDFGGKIDPDGIVGYRLNALWGSGSGYVENSHERRTLGDLGIDVHPWDHGVLELNYSDYTLLYSGFPGWFTYGEAIKLPPAPDPTRVGLGQSYAGVYLRTRTAEGRFKQDLSSDWHFVVGFLNQDNFRDINTPVNNLTSNSGNYTSSFANGFAPRFVINSDTAYLNGTLDTAGITHELSFGTAGYKATSYATVFKPTPAQVLLGSASITNPQVFAEPPQGPPDVGRQYDGSDAYQQGFNVSDTVKLTEQWRIHAGASQDWFHTNSYTVAGVKTVYREHGISPDASIIFKPVADITTYVSYASSLQAGDLAPNTAANAGESLPPYRSKQYELGYKEHFSGFDVTAAVFRLERPFANVDQATQIFEISGLQVNKGIEASAVGEITQGLRVYGGLTYIDARQEHTPSPLTDGNLYVGAPKLKGNLLFEYDVPGVRGLVTTIDYNFETSRAGNDTNSFMVAGYNVFDIGARYTNLFWDKPVTWRLSIDNVTNRFYYSTIAPSNLTGLNMGNLIAHLGSPRTVLAGVTVDL